jgi:hypothetical protein
LTDQTSHADHLVDHEHSVFSEDRWVHFFDHPEKPDLTGATFDREGRNLPDFGSSAQWKPVGSLMIGPANRPWVMAMEAGLQKYGYYLNSTNGNPLDDESINSAVRDLVNRADNIMG